MTTKLLQGTPAELQAYIDGRIAAGKTISMVVPLADKSWYLIIHSV